MPTSTDRRQASTAGLPPADADAHGSEQASLRRFYMSGDLRAATGLSRTHLDYYLREGIVEPTARTESGYLLFDDAERERLDAVIRWRQAGLGLREIRQRLGRTRPGHDSASTGDDQ